MNSIFELRDRISSISNSQEIHNEDNEYWKEQCIKFFPDAINNNINTNYPHVARTDFPEKNYLHLFQYESNRRILYVNSDIYNNILNDFLEVNIISNEDDNIVKYREVYFGKPILLVKIYKNILAIIDTNNKLWIAGIDIEDELQFTDKLGGFVSNPNTSAKNVYLGQFIIIYINMEGKLCTIGKKSKLFYSISQHHNKLYEFEDKLINTSVATTSVNTVPINTSLTTVPVTTNIPIGFQSGSVYQPPAGFQPSSYQPSTPVQPPAGFQPGGFQARSQPSTPIQNFSGFQPITYQPSTSVQPSSGFQPGGFQARSLNQQSNTYQSNTYQPSTPLQQSSGFQPGGFQARSLNQQPNTYQPGGFQARSLNQQPNTYQPTQVTSSTLPTYPIQKYNKDEVKNIITNSRKHKINFTQLHYVTDIFPVNSIKDINITDNYCIIQTIVNNIEKVYIIGDKSIFFPKYSPEHLNIIVEFSSPSSNLPFTIKDVVTTNETVIFLSSSGDLYIIGEIPLLFITPNMPTIFPTLTKLDILSYITHNTSQLYTSQQYSPNVKIKDIYFDGINSMLFDYNNRIWIASSKTRNMDIIKLFTPELKYNNNSIIRYTLTNLNCDMKFTSIRNGLLDNYGSPWNIFTNVVHSDLDNITNIIRTSYGLEHNHPFSIAIRKNIITVPYNFYTNMKQQNNINNEYYSGNAEQYDRESDIRNLYFTLKNNSTMYGISQDVIYMVKILFHIRTNNNSEYHSNSDKYVTHIVFPLETHNKSLEM